MAIQIENIVQFTGLIVGVPVSLPHGLNNPPRNLVPDVVIPQLGGFQVTADDINITVTRLADASPTAVDVWVSSWHTMRREFGASTPPPGILPDGSLVPQPFVVNQGVSSSGLVDVSAKMRSIAIQALPAAVDTKLTFDLLDYNFGSIANLGLGRFTVTEPGRYTVFGKFATATPAAVPHTIRITIYINGFPTEATELDSTAIGFGPTVNFANDFNLSAGDFVEMFAFVNNAVSTQVANGREPVFTIRSNF